MRDPNTPLILGEPKAGPANDVRGDNRHHDPVQDLANAVRRHRETDGAEPVQPHQEAAVLALPPVGAALAAHLLLAHDHALHGDRLQAARMVLSVADVVGAGYAHIQEIRSFYAG